MVYSQQGQKQITSKANALEVGFLFVILDHAINNNMASAGFMGMPDDVLRNWDN